MRQITQTFNAREGLPLRRIDDEQGTAGSLDHDAQIAASAH
jgi:hypothetical protein